MDKNIVTDFLAYHTFPMMVSETVTSTMQQAAEDFLQTGNQFKLGHLTTETPHPQTKKLSHLAKESLTEAIEILQNIDIEMLKILHSKLPALLPLHKEIKETITTGGRVFYVGCGATGRLSLSLETFWRQKTQGNHHLENQVIGFMAGGDVALIHSIEKFEDYPEFGERQLYELGFQEGDLLIATTEGGETPFVIGATLAALKKSKRPAYFLYCNPDEQLLILNRSKEILENSRVQKINLTVGPMALTGSTRMQATSILTLAAGYGLWFFNKDFKEIEAEFQQLQSSFSKLSLHFLSDFIKQESDLYQHGEYLNYETTQDLGITILTDTTERSPTFSLIPFENQLDQKKIASLSYLMIENTSSAAESWRALLRRNPRTFYWQEVTDQTSEKRLAGFDMSQNIRALRSAYIGKSPVVFRIEDTANGFRFFLKELQAEVDLKELSPFSRQIVLKMMMNTLSTLIMGRLGRYESNLMTWVRASNNKLIDRAVRYAQHLLEIQGHFIPYEELVFLCFQLKDKISRDEPLVLKLIDHYK